MEIALSQFRNEAFYEFVFKKNPKNGVSNTMIINFRKRGIKHNFIYIFFALKKKLNQI